MGLLYVTLLSLGFIVFARKKFRFHHLKINNRFVPKCVEPTLLKIFLSPFSVLAISFNKFTQRAFQTYLNGEFMP